MSRVDATLRELLRWDHALCVQLNRGLRYAALLRAVAFALVACWHYAGLAVLLVPFTLLTAASRVVLGLHYPSDVLAGAAIGAVVAVASLWI